MQLKDLRSKLQNNNQIISNLNKKKYVNYDAKLEKRLYRSLFNGSSSSQMITETLNDFENQIQIFLIFLRKLNVFVNGKQMRTQSRLIDQCESFEK
jgi:hypothetical protein